MERGTGWDGIRRRYNGKMLLLHVAWLLAPPAHHAADARRATGALSFSAVSGHPALEYSEVHFYLEGAATNADGQRQLGSGSHATYQRK